MSTLPHNTGVLRTPDERFADLPNFPYAPQYTDVDGLRIAHIEEGPPNGPTVLLMHGEPTWSFLYRKMIPVLVAGGCRVLAPDLVGFGRSDKPKQASDYSFLNHVEWMKAWLVARGLDKLTMFAQDWGSLIGLRMVAEMPTCFERVAIGNGALPTGDDPTPVAFQIWRAFARYSPVFPIGRLVKAGCVKGLTSDEVAAYNAPFPSRHHRVAARMFPRLVPTRPNDPEHDRNVAAWDVLKQWDKPFITLFSNRDPITRGGHRIFHAHVPGTQGQAHQVIRGAGHFLQEDCGPEVAKALLAFIAVNPSRPAGDQDLRWQDSKKLDQY
jgi:haloalkane dehalogenase